MCTCTYIYIFTYIYVYIRTDKITFTQATNCSHELSTVTEDWSSSEELIEIVINISWHFVFPWRVKLFGVSQNKIIETDPAGKELLMHLPVHAELGSPMSLAAFYIHEMWRSTLSIPPRTFMGCPLGGNKILLFYYVISVFKEIPLH